MSTAIDTASDVVPDVTRPRREVIYRHTFLVRLHPLAERPGHLHHDRQWAEHLQRPPASLLGSEGKRAGPSVPLHRHRERVAADRAGVTTVGPVKLDTTGVLGVSMDHGQVMQKAWPSWLTIPSYQDLADARHWHFFFAWLFVAQRPRLSRLGLDGRHLRRDLWPDRRRPEIRPALGSGPHAAEASRKGEAAKRYNVLQGLAYLGPDRAAVLMVLTGLTMSPGLDAFAPWLLDLFGGRQSARSIHFISASLIVAVLPRAHGRGGAGRDRSTVRSMITGRYADPAGSTPEREPLP